MTQIRAILITALYLALHTTSSHALPNTGTVNSCSMRAFTADSAAPFCIPGPSCVTNNVLGLPPAAPVSLSGSFGSFDHTCDAETDTTGPMASVSIAMVEVTTGVEDLVLNNGYSEVKYYTQFNGTGAPGNVPITVEASLSASGASDVSGSIARFDMRVANGTKLTAQVRGVGASSCSFFIEDETRFEEGLLPTGVCDLSLTGANALRGDAVPGTPYLVTLKASAELREEGGLVAIADPLIEIDPDAEFAPGQRYADHYEVELGEGVIQAPEPSSLLSRGFTLSCLVLLRRGRR